MANINLIKQLRQMTLAGFGDCKNALDATNDNIDAAVKYLREKGLAKAAKKAGAIAAEGAALASLTNKGAVMAEINCQTDFCAKNENFINYTVDVMKALANADAATLEEAADLKVSNGETVKSKAESLTATIGEKISVRRIFRFNNVDGGSCGIYQHANKKYAAIVAFDKPLDELLKKQIAMHIVAQNPKFIDATQVDPTYVANEKDLLIKAAKENPKFAGKPDAMINNIIAKQLEKKLAEVCLVNQEYDFEPGQTVGNVLKRLNAKVIKFVRYEVGEGIEKKKEDFAAEVAAQMGK